VLVEARGFCRVAEFLPFEGDFTMDGRMVSDAHDSGKSGGQPGSQTVVSRLNTSDYCHYCGSFWPLPDPEDRFSCDNPDCPQNFPRSD
jgi:hypothetical protein